jgi:hypothetical protein
MGQTIENDMHIICGESWEGAADPDIKKGDADQMLKAVQGAKRVLKNLRSETFDFRETINPLSEHYGEKTNIRY